MKKYINIHFAHADYSGNYNFVAVEVEKKDAVIDALLATGHVITKVEDPDAVNEVADAEPVAEPNEVAEVANEVAPNADADEVAELIAELVADAEKPASKSDVIRCIIKDAVAAYTMRKSDADAVTDFIIDRADEIDEVADADELNELFYDWNANQEIIYYQNAWNVIKSFIDEHNDFDFSEVKDALSEYGYTDINDLGSELIATILTQKTNADAFAELMQLIDDAELFADDDADDDAE